MLYRGSPFVCPQIAAMSFPAQLFSATVLNFSVRHRRSLRTNPVYRAFVIPFF
jgi:hypothetical protein